MNGVENLVLRDRSALSDVASAVVSDGIVTVDDVYSVNDLAQINAAMNPLFAARSARARAYVRPDDMLEAGILDVVLSPRMRALMLTLMPDPVLYHLHAYEIAARSEKSHVFDNMPGGWHRDPDCAWFSDDPTHVSIFVYLSPVGEEDGPFEFSPQQPDEDLRTDSPVLSMTGPIGTTFAWHRSFHHRASPNRGPRRRRLIKISVQRNAFSSIHLKQPFFAKLHSDIAPGDPFTDLLLGRYQGDEPPDLPPPDAVAGTRLRSTRTVALPPEMLETMRKAEKADASKPVAYD
jgi:hypothetical protein